MSSRFVAPPQGESAQTPIQAFKESLRLQTPTSMSKSRPHHLRTQSSPSASPIFDRFLFEKHGLAPNNALLTPPITPDVTRPSRSSSIASTISPASPVDERTLFHRSSISSMEEPSTPTKSRSTVLDGAPERKQMRASWSESNITHALEPLAIPIPPKPQEPSWEDIKEPRAFPGKYNLEGSPSRGYSEFGRGVWSVVYKGTTSALTSQSIQSWLPSPPASPQLERSSFKVVAVKAPARRDAHPILRQEALTLTYLHTSPRASSYLVPFHGYDEANHALILDALPLTLATYSRNAGQAAASNFSTKTMFDPVVGMETWLRLAQRLIDGLAFLHEKDIVHGDIKPMNILLKPRTPDSPTSYDLPFDALYCDFSSAQYFPPSADPSTLEEVSAVTTEYTSPELLSSFYSTTTGPPPRAIATRASDVFALGVTLLFAVTGESPYGAARLEIQKVGFAREGRPVDFVRMGQQGSRVMRNGVVEKVLCGEKTGLGALRKNAEERWDAQTWGKFTAHVGAEWAQKKGLNW